MPIEKIYINKATPSDLQKILLLLKTVELPAEEIEKHLDHFIVWKDPKIPSKVQGCVGLEVYQDNAIFRSLAVYPNQQGQGIGKKLTRAIIAYAKLLGIKRLYLLTTTAEKFFLKEGFKIIDRSTVPEEIGESIEFAHLCPSTAMCMMMEI